MAATSTAPPAAPKRSQAAGRGRGGAEPFATSGWLEAQRWTVLVVVGLTPLIFSRGLLEPFNLPKVTLLGLGIVTLLTLGVCRALQTRAVSVPRGPLPWVLLAFGAAVVVTTSQAQHPDFSIVGAYGRYAGAALYLGGVVLLLTVVKIADRALLERLGLVLALTLAVVTTYGLVQWVGLDPFDWADTGLSRRFSTLGQTNFAAAYVAVVLPFVAWIALDGTRDRRLRWGAASLAVVAMLYALSTRSYQGPVAIGAGMTVFLLAWASDQERWRSRWRQHRRLLLPAAAVAVVAVAVLGLAFVRRSADAGVAERRQLWEAALDMVEEEPVLGRGFAEYASDFTSYRPRDHGVLNGLDAADDPHSVPLGMVVSGGAILALAYLGVVALTGFVLVRALRRGGPNRLLLGVFGGAWVAYQAQSAVSIDVPPLAMLHWLLAGAVFVLAGTERRRLLPRGEAAPAPRRRSVPAWVRVGQAAAVMAALVAASVVTRPLRADMEANAGDDLMRRSPTVVAATPAELQAVSEPLERALSSFREASDLAPWEARYAARRAETLARLVRLPAALHAGEQASDLPQGATTYRLTAARIAADLGRPFAADRLYRRAIDLDPYAAQARYAYGLFALAVGRADEAEKRFEEALALQDLREWWVDLGEAHLRQGENEEAKEVFEHAKALGSLDPRIDAGLAAIELREADGQAVTEETNQQETSAGTG